MSIFSACSLYSFTKTVMRLAYCSAGIPHGQNAIRSMTSKNRGLTLTTSRLKIEKYNQKIRYRLI